jgi:hypothetical protein
MFGCIAEILLSKFLLSIFQRTSISDDEMLK